MVCDFDDESMASVRCVARQRSFADRASGDESSISAENAGNHQVHAVATGGHWS
jgi:hypothetical protein